MNRQSAVYPSVSVVQPTAAGGPVWDSQPRATIATSKRVLRAQIVYCGARRFDCFSNALLLAALVFLAAMILIAFCATSLDMDLPNASMFLQLSSCDFTVFGKFQSNKCEAKALFNAFYFFLGALWGTLDVTKGAKRNRMRVLTEAEWRRTGASKAWFMFTDAAYELWLVVYTFFLYAAISSANFAFMLCVFGGWVVGWLVGTTGQLYAPSWFKPSDREGGGLVAGEAVDVL